MENKKITMIAMATLAIAAFVLAYVFVVQKREEAKKVGIVSTQDLPQKEKIVCNFGPEQEAYAKMLETKDVAWCECIVTDEKMKKACSEAGNDAMMYGAGTSEKSREKCELIKREDMKASCLSSIDASLEIQNKIQSENKSTQVTDLMNSATKYIIIGRSTESGTRSDVERRAAVNKALEIIAEAKKLQPNDILIQQLEKDANDTLKSIQ